MSETDTVAGWALPWGGADAATTPEGLALTVAWCLEEPRRVGEVARPSGPSAIGRSEEPGVELLRFCRERPSGDTSPEPIRDGRISRRQLVLEPVSADRLRVENVGKCPLLVNGVETTGGEVKPGDTLTLKNVAVFLVSRRARVAPLRSFPARLAMPFGHADAHGLVGESAAIWRLRDELSHVAGGTSHVLVHGPSGSGKELAARALHALSSRASRTMLTRNAATFPEGLIDAELFGNVKNYPNPGMPERRGLIGDADQSTLFLDEIGELPHALQAHLLRVLDSGGEYQRLGDSRVCRSDVRVVAATNRPLEELKPDFVARFTARIEVPGLAERREDIPLLIRHLLKQALAEQPEAGRFFDRPSSPDAEPRVDPSLIDGLVRHDYELELRELTRLIELSMSGSPGSFVACTEAVRAELRPGGARPETPLELDRGRIEEALASARGSVTRAARALGLKNRFALYRLMKRYGIESAED